MLSSLFQWNFARKFRKIRVLFFFLLIFFSRFQYLARSVFDPSDQKGRFAVCSWRNIRGVIGVFIAEKVLWKIQNHFTARALTRAKVILFLLEWNAFFSGISFSWWKITTKDSKTIFLRARIPYRLKSVIVNFIIRACFQNLSAQKFTLLYLDNATLIKETRLPNFGEGKFVASMERYFAEIDPGPVPLLHAAFRDDPPLSRKVGECWMTLGRRFVSTTPFLLRFESVRSYSEIRWAAEDETFVPRRKLSLSPKRSDGNNSFLRDSRKRFSRFDSVSLEKDIYRKMVFTERSN